MTRRPASARAKVLGIDKAWLGQQLLAVVAAVLYAGLGVIWANHNSVVNLEAQNAVALERRELVRASVNREIDDLKARVAALEANARGRDGR